MWYQKHIKNSSNTYKNKIISIFTLLAFVNFSWSLPYSYASSPDILNVLHLPQPRVMIHLSPEFTPPHLQGIIIHPDNALEFDFLINQGDRILTQHQKMQEYKSLIKYFLASLTIPTQDQWVNLSPYEKDRIISSDFGKTEMGLELLAQDYLLKQITSSLMYPENGLGKKFWDKIYARAWKTFHTTNVPLNTFNKVWIMPDEAVVYENGNTAYILSSHLKVMLEEDYLSLKKHTGISSTFASATIREIILPALEKEVNENKHFAQLRQIYNSMILATWYKQRLKESLLNKIYADQAKVRGVDQGPNNLNKVIYQRYLMAFKRGVYNYIKEDFDQYSQQIIPRKYFSGGFDLKALRLKIVHPGNPRAHDLVFQALSDVQDHKIDKAMVSFSEIVQQTTGVMKKYVSRITAVIALTLLGTLSACGGSLAMMKPEPSLATNQVATSPQDNKTGVLDNIQWNALANADGRMTLTENYKLNQDWRLNMAEGLLGGKGISPYGTLQLSPYLTLGGEYDGWADIKANAGVADIMTKPLLDPYRGGSLNITGDAPGLKGFAMPTYTASIYGEKAFGYKEIIPHRMAISFMGEVGFWSMERGALDKNIEGSLIGGLLYYSPSYEDRVSFIFAVNMEQDINSITENRGVYPESVTAQLTQERLIDNKNYFMGYRLLGTWRPIDYQADVALFFGNDRFSFEGGVSGVLSNHPFMNDAFRPNIKFVYTPPEGFGISEVSADFMGELDRAPEGWHKGTNGILTVTIPLDSQGKGNDFAHLEIGHTDPHPYSSFDSQRAVAFADNFRASIYDDSAFSKLSSLIRSAVIASKNFKDFVEHAPPINSENDLLADLIIINDFLMTYNVDFDYQRNGIKSLSIDDIFDALRQSVISGKRVPLIVSGHDATFIAELAHRWGSQAGIKINAMPLGVVVHDAERTTENHGAAAVKGPDGKIYIIDWGILVPTGTDDFLSAIEIYQAAAGVPGVFAKIRNNKGDVIGKILTPEGREIVRKLTVFRKDHGYEMGMDSLERHLDRRLLEGAKIEIPNLQEQLKRWQELLDKSSQDNAMITKGGIDLNSSNLNLMIKRDAKGVPFNIKFQDLRILKNIEGFDPIIIKITPLTKLDCLQ